MRDGLIVENGITSVTDTSNQILGLRGHHFQSVLIVQQQFVLTSKQGTMMSIIFRMVMCYCMPLACHSDERRRCAFLQVKVIQNVMSYSAEC